MKPKRVSGKGLRIKGTNQVGMSRRELHDILANSPIWQVADEACRQAYAMRMRSRRYGMEAVWDSWLWFYDGWKDAMEEVAKRG